MPRFVILTHDYPHLHWDLLLENGESCRTLRLLTDPGLSATEITAEALPEHRLMYLDYEGPVSGNRGSVARWDAGSFNWRISQPETCEVILEGQRWSGLLCLQQIDGVCWKVSRGNEEQTGID